jgi:hypothetical protein
MSIRLSSGPAAAMRSKTWIAAAFPASRCAGVSYARVAPCEPRTVKIGVKPRKLASNVRKPLFDAF